MHSSGGATAGIIEGIEAVRAKIAPLMEMGEGEARRAAALLETFIGGCYEKSEEIDDSSGRFGQLVEQLLRLDPRPAGGGSGVGRDGGGASLLDGDDDYGYCHLLERQAVGARSRGARRLRARRTGWAERGRQEVLRPAEEGRDPQGDLPSAARCRCLRGPVRGGGVGAEDCEALAQMCLARRRPGRPRLGRARTRLEKEGRFPNRPSWGLPASSAILRKLGRSEEALASAWEHFRLAPSVYAYEDLMKFVAKGDRAEWHAKAMAASTARTSRPGSSSSSRPRSGRGWAR